MTRDCLVDDPVRLFWSTLYVQTTGDMVVELIINLLAHCCNDSLFISQYRIKITMIER